MAHISKILLVILLALSSQMGISQSSFAKTSDLLSQQVMVSFGDDSHGHHDHSHDHDVDPASSLLSHFEAGHGESHRHIGIDHHQSFVLPMAGKGTRLSRRMALKLPVHACDWTNCLYFPERPPSM